MRTTCYGCGLIRQLYNAMSTRDGQIYKMVKERKDWFIVVNLESLFIGMTTSLFDQTLPQKMLAIDGPLIL
jgi:hypothetical protein